MPDPIPQSPSQNQPVQQPVQPVVPAPEPDLITKVTQFKKQEPVQQPEGIVDIGFDYKELEGIKDPVAKDVAMKAYKSMQSGVTKKFQEASQLKKEAEEKIKTVEQKLQEAQHWSPERIQKELLTNPEFLQAAQIISQPTQNNTDSLLSDEEKAKISSLETELNRMKQANYQSLISQQDTLLQTKYADYDGLRVDETIASLAKMPPHQLREWVYKALNHDTHVKSGYEMGKSESSKLNQERVNGFSANGNQTTNSNNVPAMEKNENAGNFFARLYQNRKAELKK